MSIVFHVVKLTTIAESTILFYLVFSLPHTHNTIIANFEPQIQYDKHTRTQLKSACVRVCELHKWIDCDIVYTQMLVWV